jgi:hypothetical protein
MNGIARLIVIGALALGWTGARAPAAASAQDVSVDELKAAFLANFVKFATWPDDAVAAGGAFTFCVANDNGVQKALETTLKRHPGPAMVVRAVSLDAALPSCQLLYVSKVRLNEARPLLESLRGAPVFTTSDVDGFAEAGGVAQLRLVSGKMRFAINPAAAQRVRIGLSAKLLSLASLVKDGYTDGR